MDSIKTAIITGSGRGLGAEIAKYFSEKKINVVLNYLSDNVSAQKVFDYITNIGGSALLFRVDVRNRNEVKEMVSATLKKFSQVDVLINNAGIVRDSILAKMSEDDWDEVVGTNLNGVFNCTSEVARVMMKNKNGHIINIGSISGCRGKTGQSNYSASKAGLIGFTKSSAKELGRFNVRVNAVLPGHLETGIGLSSPSALEKAKEENVLGRLNVTQEISSFIYNLTTMENISGQVFNLDSRIINSL